MKKILWCSVLNVLVGCASTSSEIDDTLKPLFLRISLNENQDSFEVSVKNISKNNVSLYDTHRYLDDQYPPNISIKTACIKKSDIYSIENITAMEWEKPQAHSSYLFAFNESPVEIVSGESLSKVGSISALLKDEAGCAGERGLELYKLSFSVWRDVSGSSLPSNDGVEIETVETPWVLRSD